MVYIYLSIAGLQIDFSKAKIRGLDIEIILMSTAVIQCMYRYYMYFICDITKMWSYKEGIISRYIFYLDISTIKLIFEIDDDFSKWFC